MNVMIGCPVQNRAWILPYYLERILKLDYPKEKIHLAFLANNCVDKTLCILKHFKKKHDDKYWRIDIFEKSNFKYSDSRSSLRDYVKIAEVKNDWLSMRSIQDENVILIDSDILVPSNLVVELLKPKVDMISALVPNGTHGNMKFWNILRVRHDGTYAHIQKPSPEVNEVNATGACCLYSKKLLDAGVEFKYHPQGEDIGLSEIAKDLGFKIYCNAYLNVTHVMNPDELDLKLKEDYDEAHNS